MKLREKYTSSQLHKEVEKIQHELSLLNLEQDVIKETIAFARNNFDTANHERLLNIYWNRMKQLDLQIAHKTGVLQPKILEASRYDMIQAYNAQLDSINREVESLKNSLDHVPNNPCLVKGSPKRSLLSRFFR